MDLDKEFQQWWLHTGERIGADIVSSARKQMTGQLLKLHPLAEDNPNEMVRLLCRIAYCQGRIDEQTNVEQMLQVKLTPEHPPVAPDDGPVIFPSGSR